jgi:hypothetical protein
MPPGATLPTRWHWLQRVREVRCKTPVAEVNPSANPFAFKKEKWPSSWKRGVQSWRMFLIGVAASKTFHVEA